MDAKERYRQRLKLQRALVRVLELLAETASQGIAPDRTTALLAGQAISKLIVFAKAAGLTPAELLPDTSDLTRMVKLIGDRKRATYARKRRRRRGQQRKP